MRVVIVGPNLYDQSRGQFHVHAEGCADLQRDPDMRESIATQGGITLDAGTRLDVEESIYGPEAGDFDRPHRGAWLDEFHFAPCCKELPRGEALTPTQLDEFTRGYLECALWASSDLDTEEPLDDEYGACDFSERAREEAREVCERFERENGTDLAEYIATVDTHGMDSAESFAGHDLWLSRNGAGAGYFAREGVPEAVRDRLQDAARVLGEAYVYPERDRRDADPELFFG